MGEIRVGDKVRGRADWPDLSPEYHGVELTVTEVNPFEFDYNGVYKEYHPEGKYKGILKAMRPDGEIITIVGAAVERIYGVNDPEAEKDYIDRLRYWETYFDD